MIELRRSSSIFTEENGPITSRWHFTFDHYYDPQQMGFGNMRVFNEEHFAKEAKRPNHAHRDVEVLTYVVEGSLKHQDSLGNEEIFSNGTVQCVTAGSGASLSEQNASQDQTLKFIQMLILPSERGVAPSIARKTFSKGERTEKLLKVASTTDGDSIKINGNASLFVSFLPEGASVRHDVTQGRGSYIYLITGKVQLKKHVLETGDAAKVRGPENFDFLAQADSELIIVDVELK